MIKAIYFTLGLLMVLFHANAQTNMTVETSPAGNEYLISLPTGYDAAQDYPLILYLHGAQAVGADISKSFGKGLPGAINRDNVLRDYPFIVLAPHFKGPEEDNSIPWDNDKISEVLDWVESQYSIDEDRMIGSGVSLGAKGIIDFALAFPDKLAGIAPISGNAFVEDICTISNVAVWTFHGDADGTIPISGIDTRPGQGNGRFGSQVIIDSLNACMPAPALAAKLTIFKAKGHNGWDQLFDLSSGYNVYNWMEALRKGVSTGYSPLVNLDDDKSFLTSSQTLQIKSFAFDPDGDDNDLQYNWQQTSGPNQSFQNGLPQIPLDLSTAGVYSFMLTVSDVDGNNASDDITINVLSSSTAPQVSSLQFFYDGVFVENITGDYVVDMSIYDDPDDINIAAVTQNLNARASVRFGLDENNNFVTQNENKVTNFQLGGNNGTLFKPFDQQAYTITATAFGNRNAEDPGLSFQATVSFTSSPLPVELVSFSAKRENNEVVLRWTTAEEINHSHFEIYQGIENIKGMDKVAEVYDALSGESLKHYEHRISPVPECGKLYYQLKNVDYDGTAGYSKLVTASGSVGTCDVRLFPNPNHTKRLTLEGKVLNTGLEVTIRSSNGRVVRKYALTGIENYQTSLDITGLESGVYYLQIGQYHRKLLVD